MDIQAAKERCEAATDGDWVIRVDEDNGYLYLEDQSGTYICETGVGNRKNAEFIAHARSDLPVALEALEEIRIECEGYGKPIGYDPTYALAQKILAVLGENE